MITRLESLFIWKGVEQRSSTVYIHLSLRTLQQRMQAVMTFKREAQTSIVCICKPTAQVHGNDNYTCISLAKYINEAWLVKFQIIRPTI